MVSHCHLFPANRHKKQKREKVVLSGTVQATALQEILGREEGVLDSEVKRSYLGHTVPNILVPKVNNVRFNEILSSRIYCLPWDRVGT
jgi:hypothetical protein